LISFLEGVDGAKACLTNWSRKRADEKRKSGVTFEKVAVFAPLWLSMAWNLGQKCTVADSRKGTISWFRL